jgi:hypothetical protein
MQLPARPNYGIMLSAAASDPASTQSEPQSPSAFPPGPSCTAPDAGGD